MIAIKHLGHRLFIICAIIPITLLGCQSNNSQINENVIDDDYVSVNPVKESNNADSSDLLTTLNKYQWQLTEVISSPTDKTADKAFIKTMVNAQNPLMLDIQPSAFILEHNCQQYRLSFANYYQARWHQCMLMENLTL